MNDHPYGKSYANVHIHPNPLMQALRETDVGFTTFAFR